MKVFDSAQILRFLFFSASLFILVDNNCRSTFGDETKEKGKNRQKLFSGFSYSFIFSVSKSILFFITQLWQQEQTGRKKVKIIVPSKHFLRCFVLVVIEGKNYLLILYNRTTKFDDIVTKKKKKFIE